MQECHKHRRTFEQFVEDRMWADRSDPMEKQNWSKINAEVAVKAGERGELRSKVSMKQWANNRHCMGPRDSENVPSVDQL